MALGPMLAASRERVRGTGGNGEDQPPGWTLLPGASAMRTISSAPSSARLLYPPSCRRADQRRRVAPSHPFPTASSIDVSGQAERRGHHRALLVSVLRPCENHDDERPLSLPAVATLLLVAVTSTAFKSSPVSLRSPDLRDDGGAIWRPAARH
jgi:hypothetical protein